MPTKKLTEEGVQRLKPVEGKQIDFYDQVLRGLILRVNWAGRKSWRVRYSDNGKTRTHGLGYYPDISVKKAREDATTFKANLKEFLAQKAAPALSRSTFGDIADDWLKRVVDANSLRSAPQIKAYLTNVIKPAWTDRPIAAIRRGDVTKLLDTVADERGSRAADYVLAVVRQITQWHQTRVEDYVSPIVKGMLDDLKEKNIIPQDATALPQWQLHDLRRTARSLMARADVRPDVAERVLGHTQTALVETYDRHDYAEQRAQALETLATLITRIIDPPNGGNVVSMKRR